MNILALEPYYGGSHRAFLDGLIGRSRHAWTLLTLPPYKWKWRMRHAAVTFAAEVTQRNQQRQVWDLLFTSDMLNLAEFRGLVSPRTAPLPAVVYFHENQLTYPVRRGDERDLHFAFTNFVTAAAADSVWFNSAFHRDTFLSALDEMLSRMPDYQPVTAVASLRQRSCVMPPGVDGFPPRGPRPPGPMRILWAARWEHDKDPETFFAALSALRARHVPFRLSVIGESFRDVPAVFETARSDFADHIDRWGYLPSRDEYASSLLAADVIVSTARHEFFGIAVVEAVSAGAYPLLPRRLSYPELLALEEDSLADRFFYDGGVKSLAEALRGLAARLADKGTVWPGNRDLARRLTARFAWGSLVPQYDDALAERSR